MKQKSLEDQSGATRRLHLIEGLAQQAIKIRRGLALLHPQADRLHDCGGQGNAIQVLAQELVGPDGDELVHLVQRLVRSLEIDKTSLTEELDVPAELAPDTPDP